MDIVGAQHDQCASVTPMTELYTALPTEQSGHLGSAQLGDRLHPERGEIPVYLTIRPVSRKGYGSIAHEAKPNGLLTRGP